MMTSLNTDQWRFLLAFVCFAAAWTTGRGQLSEQVVRQAVLDRDCASIAAQLDTASLETEDALFYAGICQYRLGKVARAIELLENARLVSSNHQTPITYWLARAYAAHGNDSLSMAYLHRLPKSWLTFRNLNNSDFIEMASGNVALSRLLEEKRPHFNVWTTLLAGVAMLGLLLGLLLLASRSNFTRGEKWLALLVLAASTILVSYILIWTRYNYYFPYLNNCWQFLTYLVGPAVYFYLKTVFEADYSRREILLHLILPGGVFLLTLPVILQSFGIEPGLSGDFFTIGAASELLIAHLVLYTMLCRWLVSNEWQVDDNIRKWSSILTKGFTAYTLAYLSYFLLAETSFFNPQWDYAISLVMALGILVIGYMGLIQKQVFSSKPIEDFLPGTKYKSSLLTDSARQAIKNKMEHLLREQKVFKENELRLDDLAAYLDVTRHQLSQVINASYGVNFFELINGFRVEHVKMLLGEETYEHYTIQQIAIESGFNNKASFNRYFKKATGLTPSAFRLKELAKGGEKQKYE